MANIFVYGTLKRGYYNHQLMEGARHLGDGKTCGKYRLYDWGFPVAENRIVKLYPIEGECYKISKRVLHRIDRLEGHPKTYRRHRIHVRTAKGDKIRAWMYFAEGFSTGGMHELMSGRWERRADFRR